MPTRRAFPRLRRLWHPLRAPSAATQAAVAQAAATVAVAMAADAPVASVRAADPAALARALAVPVTLVLATLVLVRRGPLKAALQLLAECGSAAYEREFVR